MNRAHYVDYEPTVLVHTIAVTQVKVAQIEEHEKGVLRRRMRQRNDQDTLSKLLIASTKFSVL